MYCGQEACGSGCRDHSSMLTVQGIHGDGKYFNMDWKGWMDDDGFSSRGGRVVDARQCRDGGEVWAGSLQVFNKVSADPDQTVGDSHGRREEGGKKGQWQVGDKIYPWIYPCE